MNGIEKITARIEAEAMAQADAELSAAREKARGILNGYSESAEKKYADVLESGAADARSRARRTVRAAELEARKSNLAVKREMIDMAYDQALALLRNLPKDRYTAFMASLAAEASMHGCGELIFNTSDREEYGAEVTASANALLRSRGCTGGLRLSPDTGNFCGGLIVRDGGTETNCSLESLISQSRGAMDAEIAGILFA